MKRVKTRVRTGGKSGFGPAALLALACRASATVFPSGAHAGYEIVPFGSNQDACLHQVLASSLISAASGGNSVRISSISLAPSTNEMYNANVTIRLGYTNAVPGASDASGLQPPSHLLGGGAPNAAGAMTLFLPAGSRPYTISSASPSNFQLTFPGHPFIYDPSLGNLLVEIVTSVNGGVPAYNEAVSYAAGGPGASLAYNSTSHGAAAQPTQALRMDIAFTILPTGGCCFADGSCRYLAAQSCADQGGAYAANGVACAQANCPQPGACCMTDGSCVLEFAAACTAAGGVFSGANVPCDQAHCQWGACCLGGGACSPADAADCLNASGVFRGIGVSCAQADCADLGACCMADGSCTFGLPSACVAQGGAFDGAGVICNEFVNPCPPAVVIDGRSVGHFTDLAANPGSVPLGGGDNASYAFVSSVINGFVQTPNLYACTNGFITDSPAFISPANAAIPAPGVNFGLWANWDDLDVDTAAGGMIYHLSTYEYGGSNTIPAPVEIIEWTHARTAAGGAGSAAGNFEIKIFGTHDFFQGEHDYGPRGALVQFLYQGLAWDFNGHSSSVGFQNGAVSGAAPGLNGQNSNTPGGPLPDNSILSIYTSIPCYANCDGSYLPPYLNINDFACFLNHFASGDPYANCDRSTTPPVLNVIDFACFLNEFAAFCQ